MILHESWVLKHVNTHKDYSFITYNAIMDIHYSIMDIHNAHPLLCIAKSE